MQDGTVSAILLRMRPNPCQNASEEEEWHRDGLGSPLICKRSTNFETLPDAGNKLLVAYLSPEHTAPSSWNTAFENLQDGAQAVDSHNPGSQSSATFLTSLRSRLQLTHEHIS